MLVASPKRRCSHIPGNCLMAQALCVLRDQMPVLDDGQGWSVAASSLRQRELNNFQFMFCTLHGKCKQAFTLMAVAVQTDDFNAMDQTTD